MRIVQVKHSGNLLLATQEENLDNTPRLSHEYADDSVTIDREVDSLEVLKRHSHREKFEDEELQFCEHNYYKPYCFLKSRHQNRRILYLAKEVMHYFSKRDKMR